MLPWQQQTGAATGVANLVPQADGAVEKAAGLSGLAIAR